MKSTPFSGKSAPLKTLSERAHRHAEVDLYLKRARLAADEERFDVARVFCEKARAVEPESLDVLFTLAQICEIGFSDSDTAIALYQKIIAKARYDGSNPFCAAAREALSELAMATRGD
jgi:tetratricopeptide (TPR) repeat protein